ncbi:MAG: hypothetical protein GY798_30450 [Hyphomicrobiales bacterium]|nr:hypothetical protein [Hyphomicrobiales bacterium]
MMMLVGAAHDIDAPEEGEQTVNRMAPEAIPEFVMTLHNWRIANDVARKAQSGQPVPKPSPVPPPHGFGPLDDFAAFADEPPTMARRFGKVGRNQPCPCGSGKKYKRCCGLN